ncbi:unnamed protein product, partial [Boreogadus saida]
MIMLTLYVALDAPFDYTIVDMPALRRWWCIMLTENFQLDKYLFNIRPWQAFCTLDQIIQGTPNRSSAACDASEEAQVRGDGGHERGRARPQGFENGGREPVKTT